MAYLTLTPLPQASKLPVTYPGTAAGVAMRPTTGQLWPRFTNSTGA